MSSWEAALDRYERALDRHERLLDGGDFDPDDPWPPDQLPGGPLPTEQRARAEALLRRGEELTVRLAALRRSLPPLPARRVAARPKPHAPASQLDRNV